MTCGRQHCTPLFQIIPDFLLRTKHNYQSVSCCECAGNVVSAAGAGLIEPCTSVTTGGYTSVTSVHIHT